MEDKHRDDVEDARRRASARRKFIERRRGLLLALSIILLTALLTFGFYKLVFVVRTINVEGNLTYAAEEIIEASGVRTGLNLYSFRASTADSKVTFGCPYVEHVDVKRSPPGTVTLNVVEDVPSYYTDIFGKTVILSDGLRVLDTLAEGEPVPDMLIRLKLPAVSYSVEGRLIEFAGEKDERSIRATLEAAAGCAADWGAGAGAAGLSALAALGCGVSAGREATVAVSFCFLNHNFMSCDLLHDNKQNLCQS